MLFSEAKTRTLAGVFGTAEKAGPVGKMRLINKIPSGTNNDLGEVTEAGMGPPKAEEIFRDQILPYS